MTEKTEPRWKQRYRAPSLTLPRWAPDDPDRLVYVSNLSGSWQVHGWVRPPPPPCPGGPLTPPTASSTSPTCPAPGRSTPGTGPPTATARSPTTPPGWSPPGCAPPAPGAAG